MGTVASLLLGLALAALVEVRDSTFRIESEIVKLLELPVIALVPHVESGADRRWRRLRQVLAFGMGTIALAVGGYVFWLRELWGYIA